MAHVPPRVLLVDHDAANRELVRSHLEDAGYEVRTAADGSTAWEALITAPLRYETVMVDRLVPTVDGRALLGRIKRDPELHALPVIVQIPPDHPDEVADGIEAGAYYYLTKPVSREMVLSIVGAAVSDHRRSRILQEEVRSSRGLLTLMRSSTFELRTLEQASDLATMLARACPRSEDVVIGLTELLVNAVEHGNLEIGYEAKSRLKKQGTWREEVSRRQRSEPYRDRTVRVRFERGRRAIRISIRDQGPGFDPDRFLTIDPARAFDTHGRGIAMANQLSFDALHYHDGGREVTAVIELPGED